MDMELTSFFIASRIRVFRSFRQLLIRARRRFSIIGLLLCNRKESAGQSLLLNYSGVVRGTLTAGLKPVPRQQGKAKYTVLLPLNESENGTPLFSSTVPDYPLISTPVSRNFSLRTLSAPV